MVHNNVYRKMLGDSAWVQESLVSAAIASEARQTADLAHAFNFQPIWDQQMPTATRHDPLWPGHRHLQLGRRDRAQHRVHAAAHRRHVRT